MTATEKETLSQGGDGPGRKRGLVVAIVATVVLVGGGIALAVTRQGSPGPGPVPRPVPHPAPHPAAQVHLQTGSEFSAARMPSRHRASFTFPLVNWGDSSATIVRAGRSGPGLTLVGVTAGATEPNPPAVSPPLPITVAGHATVYLTVAYTVHRCDGVTGRWPVPVTFRAGSGAATRTVMVTPESSGPWPWHREITRGMCGHHSG